MKDACILNMEHVHAWRWIEGWGGLEEVPAIWKWEHIHATSFQQGKQKIMDISQSSLLVAVAPANCFLARLGLLGL